MNLFDYDTMSTPEIEARAVELTATRDAAERQAFAMIDSLAPVVAEAVQASTELAAIRTIVGMPEPGHVRERIAQHLLGRLQMLLPFVPVARKPARSKKA